MATLVRRSIHVLGALASVAAGHPYSAATFALCLVGLIVAGAFVTSVPFVAMLIAAVICGWAEVDGACGASHVGALTPLRALDETNRLWRRSVAAYTVAGLATSLMVGSLLGLATLPARPFLDRTAIGRTAVVAIVIVLCAREIQLINFPLPQVDRQTQKMWAVRFGHVTGAAMWGAHIGLGFATVIKHGGLYLVAACALLLGSLEGALLMSAFWIGRALPIWVTPTMVSCERDGGLLIELVLRSEVALRCAALAGFLCFAAALAVG